MVATRQSHQHDKAGDFFSRVESLDLSQEKISLLNKAQQLCQTCDNSERQNTAIEMVEILVELNLDADSLATAYLTPYYLNDVVSIDAVEEHLGNHVAVLLTGVSQMATISTLAHQGNGTVQVDNIRRMLLAMVEDVRAVVIKLAEQVCHLRNVKDAAEEERVIAAKETADIFAPLANRLGIGQLKWELEDLAFRYLHPDIYKNIAKQLDDKRLAREAYMADMVEQVKQRLHEAGIKAEVYGRPKHIYSIYKKMAKKNYEFDQLFDIRAMRIVVERLQDCYGALGIVHTNWRHLNKEFDDYVATPKQNGYQSIHTVVFGPEGKTVEIQIRTHDMHQDAELGVAAHWMYKEGALPGRGSGYEQKISWLRKLLQWQEEVVDGSDLAQELKNQVVEDRVYVFTPRGDIFDLPLGATPLDFAYYIHSNVGHRCIGAKIFGKIVPFTHQLSTGDQVEILTQKQPNPSRDWLNPSLGYIKSSRARAKIHHWFKQLDRDKNLSAGKEILDNELQKLELTYKDLDPAIKRFNFRELDDLMVAIGAGDIRLNQMLNFITDRTEHEPVIRFKSPSKVTGDKNGIVVDGVGSLMSHVARCCRPVPGDEIIGYITQGRGIAVHREDCDSFSNLKNKHPERVISVSWSDDISSSYALTIRIEASDRSGLIRDISSALANEKVNVLNMNVNTVDSTQTAIFVMQIEVHDLQGTNKVLSKLHQIEGVHSAKRGQ
ncbi:(P)ppGpp synthetase I [Pseudoalteromonas issachenkonii]|jgi:GTP pyrophosphokinase|uniref:GTP pyrophosphokinase n=6 Tax=Pseudoalteromonas TaxID=53246 RepID=A0AA37S012_9GAMM|nr:MULTISPECIES: GTP diphosphokinase [Pseudoalteromonas]PHQ93896.1 MAG: GTP diphosphokinase [Pseudoalteromonas sp.]ADT69243.1 (p)ppGpp synthetase I (GTP pyrophosphokinase) [Pseudoalteromonas sp. SM9913]ALQ55545.1 (P)ppGpp synthetase I [Pseudoalteromonas issachenkonii]ATC91401.1 GTP pyrophosphokinase [Pseudoalteromonas issachenkonii]ATD03943.1 GTP pyrophosphokinase [Pseudoalteromonas tetraodonis]|tara:strand:- start:917 stop:3073 length:2157 start_codon:yes stop_codon:yes gene_type:complete